VSIITLAASLGKLVPTVVNFGLNGKPATHPELLDWLASRLMDNGWA
jgi:hypothetical protein